MLRDFIKFVCDDWNKKDKKFKDALRQLISENKRNYKHKVFEQKYGPYYQLHELELNEFRLFKAPWEISWFNSTSNPSNDQTKYYCSYRQFIKPKGKKKKNNNNKYTQHEKTTCNFLNTQTNNFQSLNTTSTSTTTTTNSKKKQREKKILALKMEINPKNKTCLAIIHSEYLKYQLCKGINPYLIRSETDIDLFSDDVLKARAREHSLKKDIEKYISF